MYTFDDLTDDNQFRSRGSQEAESTMDFRK